MFTNNNLHDRLKTCVVGQTWPVEFYDWIEDPAVREPLQRIAGETQQDLEALCKKLQELGVEVLRPELQIPSRVGDKIVPVPPMNPGDHMCVVGSLLVHTVTEQSHHYRNIFEAVDNICVTLDNDAVCAARHFQLSDQLVYSRPDNQSWAKTDRFWNSLTHKPCRRFPLLGHIDGWFSPVTPGLIVSDHDPGNDTLLRMFYKKYFPDWEVVYCAGKWQHVEWSIADWQNNNAKRWWVKGEENNTKFQHFVNHYLKDWVGNIQESVFDVNIVVVDNRTVIVKETTNPVLLESLARHNVTVHQVPYQHATFWDGCVNCVTLALSRTE